MLSQLLMLLSLLCFFLAFGISRSVFDGGKEGAKKRKPTQDPEVKRQLRISWLVAGLGGVLLIISRVIE